MRDDAHASPTVKHGRKKPTFAGSVRSGCCRVVALRQPVGAAFFRQVKVGLHPQLCPALHVVLPVFPHDALKRKAKHLHAERILVAICLHIGQIGMVEVTSGLKRPDAGVSHRECVWLRRGEQLATEVHHRVCVALDAHRHVRVLLRLKQRAGLLRLAELLHQLAHNDSQLTADFFLQLRVALVCPDDLREV